jgi:D-glycero-alpha-D-manno-heptose-7-phosphate kinase
MLEVRAPGRADLAGGTLDLWPLYCLHAGALTVNVALGAGVTIRMATDAAAPGTFRHVALGAPPLTLSPADGSRHLTAAVGFHFCPSGGVSVEVLEELPVGSGLGGSSVLAVALAVGFLALAGRRMATREVVAHLRDLEAGVLQAPTGVQDYYPALVGGPLALHFGPGGERVERIARRQRWIAARLVVLYSGVAHSSGTVNWGVYRARIDGEERVGRALDRIAAAARDCLDAVAARDELGVGAAVTAEWDARRQLGPAVSGPELDRLIAAGVSAGALAGKACGAGGGGSVLLWTRPSSRERVAAAALAAAPAGAREIAGGVSARGATVRVVARNG